MSAVFAVPDLMQAAATDLSAIGSALNATHPTAGAPTISVLPAAADEVSASIAHLFSGYAEDYQKLAGQAAAFHEQFVQHLTATAGTYANAEAANVASLLRPLTAIATPIAAAATAAQDVLTDLVTSLLTNIQFLIEIIISLITAPLWLPFILVFFSPLGAGIRLWVDPPP
ncbi:PE family protein [Mycobacterium sp. Z3061]|uniref:PE family protein n=1 Tax=Mycobacterium sp. Z3061 TaxID=3073562 RepID=UPI002872ACB2|nr:PE family protein [Mycobacterium sp. Z3061]